MAKIPPGELQECASMIKETDETEVISCRRKIVVGDPGVAHKAPSVQRNSKDQCCKMWRVGNFNSATQPEYNSALQGGLAASGRLGPTKSKQIQVRRVRQFRVDTTKSESIRPKYDSFVRANATEYDWIRPSSTSFLLKKWRCDYLSMLAPSISAGYKFTRNGTFFPFSRREGCLVELACTMEWLVL